MGEEEMKLNIGCSSDIRKDFINLDYQEQEGVDVIHNLNEFPFPFQDNQFNEILCSHTLEHLDNPIKVMEELWRISKPGCKIKINVPHFSSGVYYWDITHKRPFSYFSMDYFSNVNISYKREQSDLFKIKKRKLNFTRLNFPFLNCFVNPILNLSPKLYERFFCWMLPCSEVIYEMEVIK